MISDRQIENILMLSFAVWFGLFGGAIGALVGSIIRPIRTHLFFSFLPGLFCAALPAAGIAIAVSLVSAIPQMLFCYDPDQSSRWDIPVWVESVQFIAVLVGGAIGAFRAQPPRRTVSSLRGILISVFAGGAAGAFILIPFGFVNGYVSDGAVFYDAIIGFVIGGFIVLLCCLATAILYRVEQKIKSA